MDELGLVHVRGLKEIEQALNQLPDEIAQRVLDQSLRKAAQPILEEAQRTAPWGQAAKGRVRLRRTKGGKASISNYGKLRLNLRIVKISNSRSRYASTVVVTVGQAFWGMFQEFGTRRMPNPPHKGWMRRAFDLKYQEALTTLRTELGAGVEAAAKRLARKRF